MSKKDPTDITFESILKTVHQYLPNEDTTILEKAYSFSKKAHEQQKRAAGDPYITHPLEVAKMLSELKLDIPTLSASLLHDVLEDTPATRDTLTKEFGKEVTNIVEGVTKIDALEHHVPETGMDDSNLLQQAENWRKMIIATANDVRVILLKLADRKHNMETLEYLKPEKRKRIADETLNLYVPLAQRLGMYELKSSMSDLSFKYLEPEIFQKLERQVKERKVQRETFLKKCVSEIDNILKPLSLDYRIMSRPKNLFSIYRKMIRQNKPFEDIQDLAGIRVITDTVEHCYAILGAIHTQFNPVPDTFTDYIVLPKNNLYQSIHTTIRIFKKQIIEIQIRTEEMHRIAEYGVAAHWRYKLGADSNQYKGIKARKDAFEERLDWLKQILEWQQETKNPKEFLEGLKVEFEFNQVFVFTPKGRVKKLPLGSTPVDFAYSIHSDLGNQCMGAKINDKMVKLDTPLKSGDRCEILIRKGQHPHKDWLDFVKTPRARSNIRKYFRENPKAA